MEVKEECSRRRMKVGRHSGWRRRMQLHTRLGTRCRGNNDTLFGGRSMEEVAVRVMEKT